MGKLIDQFFQAMQEWSQKIGISDEIIRQSVLIDVGRYDENEDTEYNLSMIKKRLEHLVEDIQLSERFLIVALIRQIEHVFEDQLKDAYKGENSRQVIRTRAVIKKLLEQTTDQELQSSVFQKRLGQLEKFERSIFPTPEKVAERKLFLDVWREVTTPLLRDVNLDETQEE